MNMICDHYCNEPLRCPECIRRFWRWYENHMRHDPRGFVAASLRHPPLPEPEEHERLDGGTADAAGLNPVALSRA